MNRKILILSGIYILLMISSLFSCKNADHVSNKSLQGKWELKSIKGIIGNGSVEAYKENEIKLSDIDTKVLYSLGRAIETYGVGVSHKNSSHSKKTLTFFQDSVVHYGLFDKSYNEVMLYKLSSDELTINRPGNWNATFKIKKLTTDNLIISYPFTEHEMILEFIKENKNSPEYLICRKWKFNDSDVLAEFHDDGTWEINLPSGEHQSGVYHIVDNNMLLLQDNKAGSYDRYDTSIIEKLSSHELSIKTGQQITNLTAVEEVDASNKNNSNNSNTQLSNKNSQIDLNKLVGKWIYSGDNKYPDILIENRNGGVWFREIVANDPGAMSCKIVYSHGHLNACEYSLNFDGTYLYVNGKPYQRTTN